MPSYLTYSQAPIPTGPEALAGPANLLAMGNTLDTLVVLKAASQANRDTLYANVPAGTLVSCASLKTVWMKTTTPPTAAAWVVLSEIGTAVTTGAITNAADFTISSQWAQRINGQITLSALLAYSGSTVTAGSNGDISDVTVCTIQSAFLPVAGLLSVGVTTPMALNNVTGSGFIGSGGTVKLVSLVPGSSLVSGNSVRFTAIYPGA